VQAEGGSYATQILPTALHSDPFTPRPDGRGFSEQFQWKEPLFPGGSDQRLLLVSGQAGSREDGSPEPDLDAQVRPAWGNLNAILKAAQCSFDDVVDVTIFIVDPESNFQRIWGVAQEFWGDTPHPTVTAVGVTWLYGFQFEIKVIAKIPD
jgi:enamine deaminase RidA (YjgF/YER057c/UK114 family)